MYKRQALQNEFSLEENIALARQFLLENFVSRGIDVYKRQLSYREYVRPAELHSLSAEENCPTEKVASLRSVKGATLPCDACASIPCGLAVRKQHKMLFAASKFDINKFGGTYDKKNDDGIMYIRCLLYTS